MDPNFLPILFSQFSAHNQILSVAKQQAEEEHQRQLLLENRQKLLGFAKTESDVLLHESSLYPQRVLIRSHILLGQMDHIKVVPDSYEDQTEKENVALLWRKLVGISDKCRKQITPAELDQCQKCLDAIWMQGLIQAIVQQLPAYINFLNNKVKLDQKKNSRKNLERSFYVVLFLIAFIVFMFFITKTIIITRTDFITSLFVLVGLPAFLIHALFRSEYLSIERTLRKYQGEDDMSFWSIVRERFNGMPTQETLDEKWKEQEEIIKVVFGEP